MPLRNLFSSDVFLSIVRYLIIPLWGAALTLAAPMILYVAAITWSGFMNPYNHGYGAGLVLLIVYVALIALLRATYKKFWIEGIFPDVMGIILCMIIGIIIFAYFKGPVQKPPLDNGATQERTVH